MWESNMEKLHEMTIEELLTLAAKPSFDEELKKAIKREVRNRAETADPSEVAEWIKQLADISKRQKKN